MKLGGWHRLWIFLSVIYLLVVILIGYSEFPRPENISHKEEFYQKLSPESREMIVNDISIEVGKSDYFIEVEMPNGHIIKFKKDLSDEQMNRAAKEYLYIMDRSPFGDTYHREEIYEQLSDESRKMILGVFDEVLYSVDSIEAKNGHSITIKRGLSGEQKNRLTKEYWDIVNQRVPRERAQFLMMGFLIWIIPCLWFYALGWGIRLIFRGFKSK